MGIRNLLALRGSWELERGNLAEARTALQEAIALAHQAGKVDRRSEIRLAVARHGLGELREAAHSAEEFETLLEAPHHLALAELWLAAGNQDRGTYHAGAAYRWACADGEPYVNRYDLNRARRLLQRLGANVPTVPVHNAALEPKLPWEAGLNEAIVQLRAERAGMRELP